MDATVNVSIARLHRRSLAFVWMLMAVLAAAVVWSIGYGAVPIPVRDVAAALLKSAGISSVAADAQFEAILTAIRIPRVVMSAVVGLCLGVSGAMMQGLFRNPLADPTLIGISGGAALATATTIVMASRWAWMQAIPENLLLPGMAFGGALVTTMVVYWLSNVRGRTDVPTMLLAGIALNALTAAGIGFLIFLATDAQLRDITFWTLGSVAGAGWSKVGSLLPFLIAILLGMIPLGNVLNALMLGEAEARHLGIPIEQYKKIVVVLVALATGAAVAMCGSIGFVGLVVPHLVRLSIGPDHRFLLPASALGGALLLVIADSMARTIVAPSELPVGIVTAFVGAPFFLWLLIRFRKGVVSL